MANTTYIVNLGNDRTNITPLVVEMKGGASDLAALDFTIREAHAGGGLVKTIIFFNTRDLAYRAYRHLKELLPDEYKTKIDFLHSMRGDSTKRRVMQQFRDNEVSILCATEAAGMGLDIGDIRRVIQFMVPTSLSQWLQRYGRAGRDGRPAIAILLIEQSVFKKVKPRGAKQGEDDDGDDAPPAEEDSAGADAMEDLVGGEDATSGADGGPIPASNTKVYQKRVEDGLRQWLETTDCRRTAANKYFENPRCATSECPVQALTLRLTMAI
ncbi:hypothetical protein EVJ58_g11198 [Rhodofomes roseus]|uniref:DNA 3'-5' helicase n=1 Tax=Rhodofomes roseus TaxID=34475 RepID=A0A4Y9XJM0_9APHY|nr:hypothetical protein EVJ58_g11198 [Rhodofomes roseus]